LAKGEKLLDILSVHGLIIEKAAYAFNGRNRLLEEKGIIEQSGGTVYNTFGCYNYGPRAIQQRPVPAITKPVRQ